MKTISLIILCLVFSISSYAQAGKTYHVSSTSLNLRVEPSTSSQVIDKLSLYDNVVLLSDSTSADWYKVRFDDKEGYVAKQYVSKGKTVVTTYEIRTGAVCRDGTSSSATGRGACSHHGGVSYWTTKTQKSMRIVED